MKNTENLSKKTWEEFRSSGLLWFINTILHMFGWAIVIEIEEYDDIIDVYPARVKFRGYSEASNSVGYAKVHKFLKENIDDIYNETKEE